MKPLFLLLVILLLAGCNGRTKSKVAKAVCDKVLADCCLAVGKGTDTNCPAKPTRTTGEDLFSVTMHEISDEMEMFTW